MKPRKERYRWEDKEEGIVLLLSFLLAAAFGYLICWARTKS